MYKRQPINQPIQISKFEATNRLTIESLNAIATLPLQELKIIETHPYIYYKKPRPKLWTLGLYASTVFPKTGGFRTGIFTQWQFHPKWSMHLGLGYSKRNPTSDQYSDDIDLADAATEATVELPEEDTSTSAAGTGVKESMDGSNNTTVGTTSLDNLLSYESFHYFELPLLIQYQATPRLSFEFGGQLARLYGYRYQDAETSRFSSPFSISHNSTIRNSNNAFSFNKWQGAILGGLAYKLSPKFLLYSNVNFGLTNNSQNNQLNVVTFDMEDLAKNQKWRQMEIGIRYFFK